MAIKYVWSGATGLNNGTSWANAYTSFWNSTPGNAGDIWYLAHDHVEVFGGSGGISTNGTVALPCMVICVNRLGSVPPVAADRRATAQLTSSGDITVTAGGVTHWDGIIITAGSATGSPELRMGNVVGAWSRFDNCSLRIGSTGAGGFIKPNYQYGSLTEWNNTTVSFANVGQSITVETGVLRWRNTPAALLGSIPTTLIKPSNYFGIEVECTGVDLSAAGAGKTIFGTLANACANKLKLFDCKLDAAVTKSALPLGYGGLQVDLVRAGAAGVNYQFFRQHITGTLNEETSMVRAAGGATDGTTPLSWKILTTASASYSAPFETPPIAVWNDTVGAPVTATVEAAWGRGALPLDSECWLEVQYLASPSSPVAGLVNDGTPNLLATPAAQTASSAAWGSGPDPFWANVKLLLGFEAGLSDESSAARTATLGGNVQTTTANPKFGTSMLCDGAGDYITFPDSPDWDFGTGPFTIELFVRFAATPTNGLLVAQWPGGGWALYIEAGKLFLRTALGDTTQYTFSPTLNQWYHIACDRDASNVARVYVNGAMISKNTYAGNMAGSTAVLMIGSLTPGGFGTYDVNGQFDEVRVSNVARYASDAGYTVPTAAFPRSMTASKLSVTFTPQQRGWVYARVKCARPSSLFYIDPKVVLS